MRSRYWSCTKFADWLRGTNKLDAGTSREWALWTLEAEKKHPIRIRRRSRRIFFSGAKGKKNLPALCAEDRIVSGF